jgi:preprotein translocase subunit YajC
MLVSTAYAQTVSGDQAGMLMQLLPFLLIFVVFYFLLIRPQQKKMKDQKAMLSALRRGDRVVTAGGIIGTIAKVINDDEVSVEIAEGVRVRVVRSTVSTVLAKTEPVSSAKDKTEEAAGAASGEAAATDAEDKKRKASVK